MTPARPHTAFVLSGGASLGAVQVGMLRALYERGIAADLLVGTSAGALNAAFVASRPQTPATAAELGRRRGLLWPAPRGALDPAIYGLSLLLDGKLEADSARYSSDAELIVLPAPNPEQVQPTDFERSARIIGHAHAACRTLLARDDAVRAHPPALRRAS